MTIDEETRDGVVNDIRNGMSYLQASKKHCVGGTAVERWCRAGGVRSLQASRRNTDKEILDAVKLHKAVTCRALAEILGCTWAGLNNRLRRMIQRGKIQSFRIPPFSSAARTHGVLSDFISVRIYYVSKEDLAEWVRSQFPEDVVSSLRRCVTAIFRSLDVKIFKETKK